MRGMFFLCKKLKIINILNFNTENVENMGEMFYGCEQLENLDLSNINTTKNVINMECINVKNKLNLKSFNTEKVKNMRGIF